MQTHVHSYKGKLVARDIGVKSHVTLSHVHGTNPAIDKVKQDSQGAQPKFPFTFKAIQPKGVILSRRSVQWVEHMQGKHGEPTSRSPPKAKRKELVEFCTIKPK